MGASHAFAALQFGSPMRSRAGAGTAATARAAGLPQGQLSRGSPAGRGRGGGSGSARGGCGGAGRRGRLLEAARPRHRPPARRAQRMTASYPAAAAALPGRRISEGPPPPVPAAPRRDSPGQPRTAQSRTAQPRKARLCRRRRGRSAFPSRSGAAAVWRLPAPPEVLTASSSANAGVPERLGTESRCQPNLRSCSAPRDPGAAAGSGVHLRPAPLSARAGSASPLLTTLGLIFHKSAAPVWGLLLPRQLVLCTALSPFSAISNLHALSFLRYRLILVWQSRFAILSHAHSCG